MPCTSPLMHPHKGEGPCPWCAEAAGIILTDKPWVPPDVRCVYCRCPRIRFNELAETPTHWCDECGKHQETELIYSDHGAPAAIFSVAMFAAYWSMDQHIGDAETNSWVIRAEWNRQRRGRTPESQSPIYNPYGLRL